MSGIKNKDWKNVKKEGTTKRPIKKDIRIKK